MKEIANSDEGDYPKLNYNIHRDTISLTLLTEIAGKSSKK